VFDLCGSWLCYWLKFLIVKNVSVWRKGSFESPSSQEKRQTHFSNGIFFQGNCFWKELEKSTGTIHSHSHSHSHSLSSLNRHPFIYFCQILFDNWLLLTCV
jgi:hypothetical protein